MDYINFKGFQFPLNKSLKWTDKSRINELIGVVGRVIIKKNGYIVIENIRITKVEESYQIDRVD